MKKYNLSKKNERDELTNILFKALQSCNINFLLGAGTSCPAIPALGNIEKNVNDLQNVGFENKANYVLFLFLKKIFIQNKALLDNSEDVTISQTKDNYIKFIQLLNAILINRKNDITK